ncbi:MAG: ABC transporter permease [Christensenellales bacterium]
MKFLSQIMLEIKNIFRSKFLLIFGILILLVSIAAPIVGAVSPNSDEGGYYPMPITYAKEDRFYGPGYGYSNEDPIIVGDVTVMPDNPFYWNISSVMDEKEYFERDKSLFTNPAALDLTLEIMDQEISYYARFAQYITTYEDYRMDLVWNGLNSLHDRFIYEHNDTSPDVLKEAAQFRLYIDPDLFDKKYINISAEQRLVALDSADDYLSSIYDVIENDNFPKYIALRIRQENENIESLKDQIEIQEQAIIDNPEQEENISPIIEDLNRQIELVNTNNIPILEYRLEKNIIPGADVWQNIALSDIENCRNQIMYTTIVTEEEFNRNQYLLSEYKSYAGYTAYMQSQIDELNNTILIGQKCLDADKPDMKYVSDGARNITVKFLDYSVIVALFAVLLGGWIMASEFQLGTVRLLMIRPKTRTKILMSKFIAALLICLGIYIAGTIINIVANGIFFGFSDYAYPNYTVSGEINFFAYYIPRFIACWVTVIFGYCVAFMLSVLVKNIAVSISVPIVCFIGCVILMNVLNTIRLIEWIAYTPVPFVQISSFFIRYSAVDMLIDRGLALSLTYGIILLMALSVICTFISVWVFKKKDITN